MTHLARRVTAHVIVLLVVTLRLAAPPHVVAEESSASDTQRAFFENVQKLCGQRFIGATEFPPDEVHPLGGKELLITIAQCDENEIRIPFQAGEDKSRTWILRLTDGRLLLKHDHRHPDGTPDKVTMYGGWAAEGTATRQRFAADEETAKLIPEAATNVWTMEIDPANGQFVYALERDGKPRYRAVFKPEAAGPK